MAKHQHQEAPKPEDEKAQLPATQDNNRALATADFGDDAGMGLENVTSAERSIPFFRILQSNSPQVKDAREGGLPGAKPGMIINIATNELFDGYEGVPFIPVFRDHNYPEWTPRSLGGGFVGIRSPDDPVVLELRAKQGQFGKLANGVTRRNDKGEALDGTELTEAYYLFGLATEEYVPSLLSFTSTQIKKYKSFMNRVTNFKYANPTSTADHPLPAIVPPMWAHRWLLQTQLEKNKKGEFYGWRMSLIAKNDDKSEAPYIKSMIPRSDPLYAQAKDLYTIISEGKAKVDYSKAEKAEDDVPM